MDTTEDEQRRDGVPFAIGVLADLSRDRRPGDPTPGVPTHFLSVRGSADVVTLLQALRPTVELTWPEGGLNAVTLELREWTDLSPDGIASQLRSQGVRYDELPAAVDRVMRHAAWRSLDATWRGLRHLAQACGSGVRPAIVRVLDISVRALHRDLLRASHPLQSRTFRTVDDAVAGGQEPPFALLVLDEPVTAHDGDTHRLASLATIAATIHAPLLASAGPELLMLNGFDELNTMRFAGVAHRLSMPDRLRFRALQTHAESRFAWMLLPRVLVRDPDAFGWAASATSSDDASLHWIGPAYVLAAQIAALVRDTGSVHPSADWGSRLLAAMPHRRVPRADGGWTDSALEAEVAPPMVDALLTERLAFLGAARDRMLLPSLFRAAAGDQTSAIDLSLHDTLWATQLVHQIRRRWTRLGPASRDLSDRLTRLQGWLSTWATSLGGAQRRVTVDVDTSTPDIVWAELTIVERVPNAPNDARFVTRFVLPRD